MKTLEDLTKNVNLQSLVTRTLKQIHHKISSLMAHKIYCSHALVNVVQLFIKRYNLIPSRGRKALIFLSRSDDQVSIFLVHCFYVGNVRCEQNGHLVTSTVEVIT